MDETYRKPHSNAVRDVPHSDKILQALLKRTTSTTSFRFVLGYSLLHDETSMTEPRGYETSAWWTV